MDVHEKASIGRLDLHIFTFAIFLAFRSVPASERPLPPSRELAGEHCSAKKPSQNPKPAGYQEQNKSGKERFPLKAGVEFGDGGDGDRCFPDDHRGILNTFDFAVDHF